MAARVFGGRLELARRYADLLADTGVSHGLIGPREVGRLWDRHLLNCAVIEDAFPPGSRVIDVGSGAGLPGIVLAIARADLDMHLIEPMRRRTEWLCRTISDLGLTNCTVHRGRAEEFHGVVRAPYVTARAVARLDRLCRWALPLVEPGGLFVAMKGRSAREELDAAWDVMQGLGAVEGVVTTHGVDIGMPPTLTVDVRVGGDSGGESDGGSGSRRKGSRGKGGPKARSRRAARNENRRGGSNRHG